MRLTIAFAAAVVMFAGCGKPSLVGRKLEFTERNEVVGCREKHQAIELFEKIQTATGLMSRDDESDPKLVIAAIKESTDYIDQLKRTEQAKKIEWTTTATIEQVENYNAANGDDVVLLKLDIGYWIPHWPDGSHGELKLVD